MNMNHLVRGIAVTIIIVLVGGCGRDVPDEAGPVVRPIKMLEVSSHSGGKRFEYPGRVSPVVQTELSFEVPGRINAFPVHEGQQMRAGELIARLDDRNYRAELTASQARLNAAKADYDRFKDLFDKTAVSQRDLESRRRNYEVARANHAIAEKALEDTELRAHFAGRIARKLVNDFQNVLANEPVVLLQDDSILEIKADVPERDLATEMDRADLVALTRRLSPMVSITSIPGSSFPAKLKELATAADPRTRTFEVTFSFEPNAEIGILPGMTARITVEQPSQEGSPGDGFVIPSNAAVIDDQGSSFVWRVDRASMQVEAVHVNLGEIKGNQITVSGNLSDGDLIATSGVHQLREGTQVRRMP